MKKYTCIYKNRCGGDTCERCKGYTTKTEIKHRLKDLLSIPHPGYTDKQLIKTYTELLQGARK